MSNVKRQFGVDSLVVRAFLNRPLYVDNQIAGRAIFSRDGLAPETDDIRRTVFAEKLAVMLRDAFVIGQQKRDLFPDGVRIGILQQAGEFSGQLADCQQIDPAFLPVYQSCFHF